jgi:hypothetical protein
LIGFTEIIHDNYEKKINLLYDHLRNSVLKNSDLITGIKEINEEITTTDFMDTIKMERKEMRIREQQLSGVARVVTRRYKTRSTPSKHPKLYKTRRKRAQQAIQNLNIYEMGPTAIPTITEEPSENPGIIESPHKEKTPEPPLEEDGEDLHNQISSSNSMEVIHDEGQERHNKNLNAEPMDSVVEDDSGLFDDELHMDRSMKVRFKAGPLMSVMPMIKRRHMDGSGLPDDTRFFEEDPDPVVKPRPDPPEESPMPRIRLKGTKKRMMIEDEDEDEPTVVV